MGGVLVSFPARWAGGILQWKSNFRSLVGVKVRDCERGRGDVDVGRIARLPPLMLRLGGNVA